MKFELFEDLNRVEVTAENAADVAELQNHYKIWKTNDAEQMQQYAQVLGIGHYVHTLSSKKRTWFHIKIDCGATELYLPYLKLLKQCTGFELKRIPDMTFGPANRLDHRFLLVRTWIQDGIAWIECYDDAEEWNRMTPEEYARHNMRIYLSEMIAHRPVMRQYLEGSNGQFKLNPDWGTGKRMSLVPSVESEELWMALWNWWKQHHASDRQLMLIKKIEAHNEKFKLKNPWEICSGGGRGHVDFTIHFHDPDGPIDYDRKGYKVRSMKWEEFIAAK